MAKQSTVSLIHKPMLSGRPRSLFRVQRSSQTCSGLASESGADQAARLVRMGATGVGLEVVSDPAGSNGVRDPEVVPWGRSPILCADHSFDSRWFVVGSKSHSLYAYETPSEQPLGGLPPLDLPAFQLTWHPRTVISAAFHPSKSGVLASGGFESWVGIWDLGAQRPEGRECRLRVPRPQGWLSARPPT